ncbi:DUF192 domain-containing protein [uncultured Treponema sp.]|uniref:DUF192 domain-containing protein n=1 Tax=uncultured Treponema sp. TaxID=162155 RepID=UPI0025D21BF2|nr:DUF192 domain-containing protein [uncultured Treponema sp.]
MIRKSLILSLFISCILLFSCAAKSKLPVKKLILINSDGQEVAVKAEIASTFEERRNGFMFRQKIPDGTGMLFIFEEEQILDFWMKNTPHPLSIAYIDKNGKIRDILDMTPYSLANVTSSTEVLYALEVPQGWYEKVNVKVGDRLRLDF